MGRRIDALPPYLQNTDLGGFILLEERIHTADDQFTLFGVTCVHQRAQ